MCSLQVHGPWTFGTRTSNSSEVEGGVLKQHSAGPKPNQTIAKAAESVSNVTDMRMTLKEQKVAKALYRVPVDSDPRLSQLYEHVMLYCANQVQQIWECRVRLAIFRALPHLFYVKLDSFTMYVSNPCNEKEFLWWLIPKFERTRVVQLLEFNCWNSIIKCT
jgi:hypothetical protein